MGKMTMDDVRQQFIESVRRHKELNTEFKIDPIIYKTNEDLFKNIVPQCYYKLKSPNTKVLHLKIRCLL